MINGEREYDEITFDVDAAAGGSSGEAFSARPERKVEAPSVDVEDKLLSPVFKLLSRPVLPELGHDTRARLMMQSPTRLYFYWSIGVGSYHALQTALGGRTSDYRLALRLLNLTTEAENLYPIEPSGSWWFDVEDGAEYRAEVGFYSTSRPFVRVLYSNTIATPRKSPSPRSSRDARWAVSTGKFVELLDASGFERDAFEIIHQESGGDLRLSFARHVGVERNVIDVFDLTELLKVLDALAAGTPIDDLKWKVSEQLYAFLQAHFDKLSAAQIQQNIGLKEIDDAKFEAFPVVGGSLVNIPRRRFRPISSLELR